MRSATCTNSLPLVLPVASIAADPWAVAVVGMAPIICPMRRESKAMVSHTQHYYEINGRAARSRGLWGARSVSVSVARHAPARG